MLIDMWSSHQHSLSVGSAWHPLINGCAPEWASSWGEDKYGVWVAFAVQGVEQRLRWILPGRFMMGSPDSERERLDSEGPQHAVTLTQGYWLAETACTQALWLAVMGGENPSRFQDDLQNPVEQVSWHDIQRFLTKLNTTVPGLALTLPTEAQWEYACRAGTTTPFSFGENITPEQVNYHGNYPYADGAKGEYRGQTVPVRSLPPNAWGLYEMHGNVWEWCLDGLRTYDSSTQTDPVGPLETKALRVFRGGSWNGSARFVRSAHRIADEPDYRGSLLGFRCARVQPGEMGQAGSAPGRVAQPRLEPDPAK